MEGKEERRKEANWMRKDGEDKKEREMEAERETEEEMGKKEDKRRGERNERDNECQKKVCRFYLCRSL